MSILRNIFAAVAGIVAGGLTVLLVETLSTLAHPKPENLDIADTEAMREWIQSLPLTAFAAVLAAWSLGAFVGVWLARMLAANRSLWPAIVSGCMLLLATIASLIVIPHPLWFAIAGIAVYPVFGLLGLAFSTPREMIVSAEREISADKLAVFRTLADIKNFSLAVPEITNVEFLTEQQYGVGTRFRETRLMNGKEAATELEVTELIEGEHIRLVSIAGGTLWDTAFKVSQETDTSYEQNVRFKVDNSSDEKLSANVAITRSETRMQQPTQMRMSMSCQPQNFFAKIMVPAILPMVSKCVQADMDAVKAHCEA